MKRTISLILALIFALAMAPAVLADVLWIPEDDFLNDHLDVCDSHGRGYYAAGPDGRVTVYKSPDTNLPATELENGTYVWISWEYTDKQGHTWGFCEHWDEDLSTDWSGWMPLAYLHLKYDYLSFREEFADRIEARSGILAMPENGVVVFWDYPGSDSVNASLPVENEEELPNYMDVFTDDAGREWGFVGYDRGIRNVWVCLDHPGADYETLYAELPPQQITPPTAPDHANLAEIKPGGPDLKLILAAVCAVAAASGGFLWFTRKKK